jgi:hypothetical protein
MSTEKKSCQEALGWQEQMAKIELTEKG